MSLIATFPDGPGPEAVSPRLRLARLAKETALRVPGVLDTTAGPSGTFTVVSGRERVDGVLCAASAGGGYDVSLALVCGLVPLHDLAERVKAAVVETATAAGLPLESVSIHIAGVADPQER